MALTLGMAQALVVLAFGGSASGAVIGLQRVQADSVSDSSASRAATATCPAGKQVLGGGAELIGGESQVTLNDVIPNAALTGVTAQAYEDQTGYTGVWALRAVAICAYPPPGLELVVATSPTDSVDKTVSATCPAGKRLLGAGGSVTGGGRQVMAQDIRLDSVTRVTSEGVEDQDGTALNWNLRAYAVCSTPVQMLQRVVATSASDSLKGKLITASCPAGKRVVGVGGEVGGIGGQVALADMGPTLPLDGATANALEDEDGTASNWTVRAYAICAAVSERVVATSPTDSEFFKAQAADCAGDLLATGGGADVTGGAGEVRVDGIFPLDDPAPGPFGSIGFFADAFEDETGRVNPWFLRAISICATPHPGLHAINEFGGGGSETTQRVTAECPAGTRVLGAGGGILTDTSGGYREVVMLQVAANDALTRVIVTGHEDETGDDREWTLFAHPVCANPPPGLELVTADSPLDSVNKSVTATCPPGKHLLGTGATIIGGAGQVVLDDITPMPELMSAIVTGREDETGMSGNWSLRSQAICASM